LGGAVALDLSSLLMGLELWKSTKRSFYLGVAGVGLVYGGFSLLGHSKIANLLMGPIDADLNLFYASLGFNLLRWNLLWFRSIIFVTLNMSRYLANSPNLEDMISCVLQVGL
jgi:hypothetical protein